MTLNIIVLTRISPSGKNKKKSIKFGWMPNVVHYVVKKELSTFNIQQKFHNLCRAIIEDYDNKQWVIEYAGRGAINLHNSKINTTSGVDISTDFETALVKCMESPNKPVVLPDNIKRKLHRIRNRINENVMEKTNWNTWGILSKENCATGQLKLVVGSVKPFPITNTPENPYITRSEYYEGLKKYITRFDYYKGLTKLENEINIIKETLAIKE